MIMWKGTVKGEVMKELKKVDYQLLGEFLTLGALAMIVLYVLVG